MHVTQNSTGFYSSLEGATIQPDHLLTPLSDQYARNHLSTNIASSINAMTAATIIATTDPNNPENLEEVFREIHNLVSVVVPIFFSIIALSGFFGNTLVILVVLLNQRMRSTTNLLIVNLAVADLLFVVVCIPFTAIAYVAEIWPFGDLWCRAVQYLIVVTAFASIYTLVLMSVDRFLAVVHPIRSRAYRTEKVTKIAILTLWMVIVGVTAPVPLSHGVAYEYDSQQRLIYAQCQFMQNDYVTFSAYQLAFLISSYLLPLVVISALYVRMVVRLWQQGGGVSGVRMSVETQRGRKRVTRLVVVVVIAFASLWLPVQLILMLRALDLYYVDSKFKAILQVAAQTLAYTSSCINPLLYAFLSENFRKAFRKAVYCSARYQNCSSDLPPPARRPTYARTSTSGL